MKKIHLLLKNSFLDEISITSPCILREKNHMVTSECKEEVYVTLGGMISCRVVTSLQQHQVIEREDISVDSTISAMV